MVAKVLILDDPTNLPRFIAMELQAAGYQVSIICDNVAELSVVQSFKPDVILLNWDLRQASGIDICQQLQFTYPQNQHQAAVMIAIANDDGCCYLSQQSGAQICLIKPFSMDELLATIEQCLKRQSKEWDFLSTTKEMGVSV